MRKKKESTNTNTNDIAIPQRIDTVDEQILRLYVRGYHPKTIATRIRKPVSFVEERLAFLIESLSASISVPINRMQIETLLHLKALEADAWDAWDASKSAKRANSRHWANILECIKERNKLLSLYEPEKARDGEPATAVNVLVQTMSPHELATRVQQELAGIQQLSSVGKPLDALTFAENTHDESTSP